jgi:hypothetical protein
VVGLDNENADQWWEVSMMLPAKYDTAEAKVLCSGCFERDLWRPSEYKICVEKREKIREIMMII